MPRGAKPDPDAFGLLNDAGSSRRAKRRTNPQIGLNAHGAVYITIPGLLAPPDLAERSLHDLIKRLRPFTGDADPLAVVNSTPANELQLYLQTGACHSRPSGDTTRLSANLVETRNRERLSPDNTIVAQLVPGDRRGIHTCFSTGWNPRRGSVDFKKPDFGIMLRQAQDSHPLPNRAVRLSFSANSAEECHRDRGALRRPRDLHASSSADRNTGVAAILASTSSRNRGEQAVRLSVLL